MNHVMRPIKIANMIDAHGKRNEIIWGDSASAGHISYLRRKGFKVYGVNKPAGSVAYGVSLLKKLSPNIVDCPEWRKEQTSYKHRVINGIKQEQDFIGIRSRMGCREVFSYVELYLGK
jgi:phage terminase large subunit